MNLNLLITITIQEFQNILIAKLKTNQLKEFTKSIIDGFKDSEAIFQYIGYPNCPDCENCKLSTTCLTTKNIQKYTNIKRKFKENLINQNKFATLV
ncbi:hypothetical protein FPN184_contig00007-0010 [Flavobacterium psychrophilum]|nr:hypothetical protein FPN184_contig00007-0010 [Flavobacterium psychrophilum]